MKTLTAVLAVILLAIPVALLVIFNLPGMGILLGLVLAMTAYWLRSKKKEGKLVTMSARQVPAEHKKAA